MICQQLTPERFGFVLALFYRRQLRLFNFTGHWLLTTILPSHAPRRDQRGQVVRRPSPAGYCLTPTAELEKNERARSRRAGRLFQYVTEPGNFCGKINPSLPTRCRPTVEHSLAAGDAQRQR